MRVLQQLLKWQTTLPQLSPRPRWAVALPLAARIPIRKLLIRGLKTEAMRNEAEGGVGAGEVVAEGVGAVATRDSAPKIKVVRRGGMWDEGNGRRFISIMDICLAN